MTLTTRHAVVGDLYSLARNLRQADLQEIEANSGEEPLVALLRGFAHSTECHVIESPRGLVGIYGAVRVRGFQCPAWALATPLIEDYRKPMARLSRVIVRDLCKKYGTLHNWADCRNVLHLRWLRWVGAEFLRREPYGQSRLPFQEFIIHV